MGNARAVAEADHSKEEAQASSVVESEYSGSIKHTGSFLADLLGNQEKVADIRGYICGNGTFASYAGDSDFTLVLSLHNMAVDHVSDLGRQIREDIAVLSERDGVENESLTAFRWAFIHGGLHIIRSASELLDMQRLHYIPSSKRRACRY